MTQQYPLSLSTPTLQLEGLLLLLQGGILAYRIPGFLPSGLCQYWQKPLQQSKAFTSYTNAPDVPVHRVGMTLFEAANRPELLAEYFQVGQNTFAAIESLFDGGNPLRVLQHQLQNIWPAGGERQTWQNREMSPGIIRSFKANPTGGLPPHVDTLLKDLPSSKAAATIERQLAANLYLEKPDAGGELHIWDFEPTPYQQRLLLKGHYDFFDERKLPGRPLIIKPQVGELILFRSSCVHAVAPIKQGRRTTTSCFVGYYGQANPLRFWA